MKLIALLVLTFAGLATCDVTTLWPNPASVTSGSTLLAVSPSLSYSMGSCAGSSDPATVDLVQASWQRYLPIFFWWAGAVNTTQQDVQTVTVCINANAVPALQLGVSEKYSLSVSPSGAVTIEADNYYGFLRGLETLSQLIEFDDGSKSYQISGAPIQINDQPAFPWRGLLVDSARHFLPVTKILSIIDSLTYSKFNTLHWHIIDAQSFPFQSQRFPLLWKKGSYRPSSAVFSFDDIQNVVKYATERGVRVVVEFDGPGHSAAFGKGYPSVVANCPSYAANINNIPLTPASNLTIPMLKGLYDEVVSLFPDNYFHVGGDEVVMGCWSEDPAVQAWMAQQGYNSSSQVYQYFEDQITGLTRSVGRVPILWEDPFDHNLNIGKDVVIQVWRDQATLQKVVSAGYTALLSAGWYLDQQIPNPKQTFYEFEDTWINFYQNSPYVHFQSQVEAGTLTEKEASDMLSRVLGGEASMWGEQVFAANFDARVWPRAAAPAEVLWSPSLTSIADATRRLSAHSCRLARRGIAAGPLEPDFCLLN